jgi:hypothetical protein
LSLPAGSMDMALGLRTMVIPTANSDSLYAYSGTNSRREWTIHLQVRGAGASCWHVYPIPYRVNIGAGEP